MAGSAHLSMVCDDGGVPDAVDERRPRRSRDELSGLLIGAGRAILEEEGLSAGADDLTFKRVFDHVEAADGIRSTNAPVIGRVWDSQDEFQIDVLIAIASEADSSGEIDRTLEVLSPRIVAFDRSSPGARMRVLSELARVVGEVGMRARIETRDWSLWLGVWVLALTTQPTGRRSQIRVALTDGLEAATDSWEQLFGGICAHLGFRVRDPLTLRQFTVAVSAMAEGSALRQGGDPELALIDRPTGSSGELREWTLFGVCMEALALRFFEIGPAWVAGPAAG